MFRYVFLPWLEHIHFMVTPTWHVDLVEITTES